ncbi:hypothetical protein Tsubulata_035580 [Turnera subulata]|uniref:non-specific serine/threonine protein kinase n=1 Tax=Turnera subulata TaxID=218843 RepID=A0A9Q0FZA6_9ROSI|nr:hypothetical protein Tsubulata_035580 [Turnera subulata]
MATSWRTLISSSAAAATTSSSFSCPVDLSYVKTVPWDASLCQGTKRERCCGALLSLYGMGMAQHLKNTSEFQLPTRNASASCLSDFQEQLAALSIGSSVVPTCFPDPDQFVSSPSQCGGIVTLQDWIQKAGPTTPMDTACRGDFSDSARCGLCFRAGQAVNLNLTTLYPSTASKCFSFVCLYAAAFISDSGPMDPLTASCTLRLPLANAETTRKPSKGSKDRLLKVLLASFGGVLGVLLASALAVFYRKWERERKQTAYASGFSEATLFPNSGAKWFRLSELEQATNWFSQKNFLGQGGFGVVYKGTLEDGTLIAVKEMQAMDLQGDEEFSNEVEILCKIRHRNLLSLRGCCVATDDYGCKRRYLQAKHGKMEEILDETIKEQGPKAIMERFVLVGILCAHVMVAFRPTIADALKMLEGDIDIPQLPDRPLPLSHDSLRPLWDSLSISETSGWSSSTSAKLQSVCFEAAMTQD